MEYENEYGKEDKVGAGILTLCILHFVGAGISLLASIALMALSAALLEESGSTTVSIIVGLFFTVANVIACIMLLLKQKAGVFLYYGVALLSFFSSIALSGFSFTILVLSLIFPVLMGVFVSKKKELYGLGSK